MKEIYQFIESHENEFKAIREHLHQHPELSWQEFETSKFIKNKLTEWGLTYKEMAGTGVVADLIIDKDFPLLAYRADIDALPIQDGKECTYKSKVENVCHACGHDLHTTALLGSIKTILAFKENLQTNLRFIFQPAEEVTPGGARKMISENVLKGVDKIIAMHVEPNLSVGKIGVVKGWVTTQSVSYKIKIIGKGAHSARPHQCIDPIFVASNIIQKVYTSIARKNSFQDYFVLSFTTIHGGNKVNVIPDECVLEASLRLTNPDKKDEVVKWINEIILTEATLFNAKAEIQTLDGDPPVINDATLADFVTRACEPLFGAENIADDTRTMGGEDFSNFTKLVPGVYIRFGMANDQLNHSLHSPHFDIDPKSILLSIKMFTTIIFSSKNG